MRRILGRKPPDPSEQAKEWKRNIHREMRTLERQITTLETAEKKVTKEIKDLAKQGSRNEKSIKVLARQLVSSRNAKNRMYEGRAHLHSVEMQLNNQISMLKVSGVMKKSTEVMKTIGSLVKIPELQKTMMDLAREMEKAGLVEEIVSDGLDMVDGEGVEEEASREVDAVIAELTAGVLEGAGAAPTAVPEVEEVKHEEEVVDEGLSEMKSRLESL
ncbi:unnamed protein product [Choristocarpus tenellus]